MLDTTVIFRPPSLKRFLFLLGEGRKGLSLLRCLEYEIVAKCQFRGKTLDFGGGSRTNYTRLLGSWMSCDDGCLYESANIDPRTDPTYLLSQDGEIPVGRGEYDLVISLNTLEHVYFLEQAITEIYRVLKPEGEFMFAVPFMFRVHGHPDDYMRGTPSFWKRLLISNDFNDVEIEVMNWGPFSTGLFVSGMPGPLKRLRVDFSLFLDLLHYKFRYGRSSINDLPQDHALCSAPLGYFIHARK